jgi:hypothetical protein
LEIEKVSVPQSQPKVEATKVTATAPTKNKRKQLLKEAVERKEALSQVTNWFIFEFYVSSSFFEVRYLAIR